jgi:hypothetical protein
MSNLRPLLAALTLAAAGCSSPHAEPALRDRLVEALAKGEPVELRSVTPFAWDRVHVIPPYTQPNDIREATALEQTGAGRFGIEKRDDICLLVFVKGGKLVEAVDVPRDRADFAKLREQKGLTPAQAVFVLRGRDVTLSAAR